MPRYVMFPYKMASESSKTLTDALRASQSVLRVYPDRAYTPRASDIIINWGNSTLPQWYREGLNILNHPEKVRLSQNKLTCLQTLQRADIPTIPFTTSRVEALQWEIVFARTLLRGSEGRGIVVANINTGDTLPNARLYTKHVNPRAEYRVHIFQGRVIDYAKKIKEGEDGERVRAGEEFVRNHGNGWIFARGGYERIPEVERDAIRALEALGLDFGSVDIIRTHGRNYILEVNSASGLSDMGIQAYVEAITHI